VSTIRSDDGRHPSVGIDARLRARRCRRVVRRLGKLVGKDNGVGVQDRCALEERGEAVPFGHRAAKRGDTPVGVAARDYLLAAQHREKQRHRRVQLAARAVGHRGHGLHRRVGTTRRVIGDGLDPS
jgi:hypothetical protein